METKIFDKETMLDLIVNFIPLGILLFFITAFIVWSPWGFDLRYSGPMLVIMGGMFIALVVLTYFSAVAIAGDERTKPVYPQGQAGLEGAKTVHELEAEMEGEDIDHESDAGREEDEAPGGTTSGDDDGDDGDDTDEDRKEADGEDQSGADVDAEETDVDTEETDVDTTVDAQDDAADDADAEQKTDGQPAESEHAADETDDDRKQ